MKFRWNIAFSALLGLGMGSAQAADSAPPAVFTAAQASAGATVYSNSCAACHGKELQGLIGPALKGEAFHQMAAGQNLTADSLMTVVSLTMPQDNPASLTEDQYNQIVAYILQQNGFPAGDTPLTKDAPALKTLQLK